MPTNRLAVKATTDSTAEIAPGRPDDIATTYSTGATPGSEPTYPFGDGEAVHVPVMSGYDVERQSRRKPAWVVNSSAVVKTVNLAVHGGRFRIKARR